ncbi:hypothetical protein CRG98_013477 [Punica granatum]|uniref:Uncharacterized protein n=1 Tax=Punica granatum TaxID=22663 RepID=A0A2I0KC51_PUNGR|nr:hypothetical protein CRG98_013477 [Punica granatum]
MIEGPAKKGEGESSRKTATATAPTNSRRGKEVSVNAVNLGHHALQQYLVSFTPAPSTTPTYAPPPSHYLSQLPLNRFITRPHRPHFHQPRNKSFITTLLLLLKPHSTGPQLRELLSQCNRPQPHWVNKVAYRNLGNGVLGYTTDNYWKLREKIQQMIDDKKLFFNAVRPSNVQANSLPNHESSSGPTINMISVYTIGEYETKH